MALNEIEFKTIDGESKTLADFTDKAVLIVNVASHCGLTSQYAGLQALQDAYGDRGFTVLGFPCNQFGAQEPGTHDEIKTFCESSFGVSFPLMAKIEVNGESRHPLYEQLTQAPDLDGKLGDVRWNFEKFLVAPGGEVVARFSPLVTAEDERLIGLVEDTLPVSATP